MWKVTKGTMFIDNIKARQACHLVPGSIVPEEVEGIVIKNHKITLEEVKVEKPKKKVEKKYAKRKTK